MTTTTSSSSTATDVHHVCRRWHNKQQAESHKQLGTADSGSYFIAFTLLHHVAPLNKTFPFPILLSSGNVQT